MYNIILFTYRAPGLPPGQISYSITLLVYHNNIPTTQDSNTYTYICVTIVILTFTFRAFSRRFYPEWLTRSIFVRREREKTRKTTIYLCQYSKDVHRTKCQALTITRLTHSPYTLTITRLTHSPYTTKIARIRCYTTTILFWSPWKYNIQ